MDFSSQPVNPDYLTGVPFDVEGFRNLLASLKESKEQKENKAKPLYDLFEE